MSFKDRSEAMAWAAGILEGEGSFLVASHKRETRTYSYAMVTVAMSDEDVIEKLAALFENVGSIGWRKPGSFSTPHKKKLRCWQVQGQRAEHIMAEVRPFMGLRRGAKIDEVLKEVA